MIREIELLDTKITSMVQCIHELKLKRDFMDAFIKNPVGFINEWIGSQARDLGAVMGEPEVGFFEREGVREAMFHYLAQQS